MRALEAIEVATENGSRVIIRQVRQWGAPAIADFGPMTADSMRNAQQLAKAWNSCRAIASRLDRAEWDADALADTADALRAAGFIIRDTEG